jgi:hypothetical protein
VLAVLDFGKKTVNFSRCPYSCWCVQLMTKFCFGCGPLGSKCNEVYVHSVRLACDIKYRG